MLKKRKRMGQKAFFSKKSKRGYKRLFLICLRQVSNKRIQTSIIHIAPCSQEIIDNENPIFLRFVFLEDAKWGCLVAMVTIIVFLSMATDLFLKLKKQVSSRIFVWTSRSFSHSWLITGFVNIVTRLVPLVVEADEGDYACQATNIAESASSSNSRLIINGGRLIQESLLTEYSHFSQLKVQ